MLTWTAFVYQRERDLRCSGLANQEMLEVKIKSLHFSFPPLPVEPAPALCGCHEAKFSVFGISLHAAAQRIYCASTTCTP